MVEETWDTGLSLLSKVKNSDLGEVHPMESGKQLPSSVTTTLSLHAMVLYPEA